MEQSAVFISAVNIDHACFRYLIARVHCTSRTRCLYLLVSVVVDDNCSLASAKSCHAQLSLPCAAFMDIFFLSKNSVI